MCTCVDPKPKREIQEDLHDGFVPESQTLFEYVVCLIVLNPSPSLSLIHTCSTLLLPSLAGFLGYVEAMP
jgi:hypothetical protein